MMGKIQALAKNCLSLLSFSFISSLVSATECKYNPASVHAFVCSNPAENVKSAHLSPFGYASPRLLQYRRSCATRGRTDEPPRQGHAQTSRGSLTKGPFACEGLPMYVVLCNTASKRVDQGHCRNTTCIQHTLATRSTRTPPHHHTTHHSLLLVLHHSPDMMQSRHILYMSDRRADQACSASVAIHPRCRQKPSLTSALHRTIKINQ